ncbi:tripartite tricarboxylate transporter substrate binding protein [Ramlibacter sp. WS9]|uniref:Bug family tripartite tricarboxylate transporter substrate binding protein n=1 Tax=Ramlibacter sp. WS9 TaxID=1882741 RepID=UPI0013050AA5|nr:tripartite tricarboxylate transporter substrate binding protein [Ramlibacter sp. WS9]
MATHQTASRWQHFIRTFIACCAVFAAPAAQAQAPASYPSRPVTLVVPFAAGGATDVVARLLAGEVSQQLGQPVLVDNKPGAAGALGANHVAKSAPDGYTVCLCGGGPMVMLALLDPKLPYVPTRDLAPVILSHLVDFVMVVRADTPYKTLAELVAAAKARPGAISYGSTGIGGPAHLGMELFKQRAGASFLHVPYKGESNVTTDMLGGQIEIGLFSVQQATPLITAGKVRALAVWPPIRSKTLPTVPTVAEQGYPDYFAGTFVGINVAGATPAPIIDKLYTAFDAALKKPAVRGKLEEMGFTPMALPPAGYAAFLHREHEKWAKVIAETGMKGRE